jgi:hypothetical protein
MEAQRINAESVAAAFGGYRRKVDFSEAKIEALKSQQKKQDAKEGGK